MNRAALLCLVPLFALALHVPAAEQVEGRIVELRSGRLERIENGQWHSLAQGGTVLLGDRLRTDRTGLAILELPEIGRMMIGPGSEIELGHERRQLRAQALRGSVWLKGELPAGATATIATPMAVAGIRGTRFSVHQGDDGEFHFCTCEGKVSVTLHDGHTVEVTRGEMLESSPAAPQPVAAGHVLHRRTAGYDFCYHCHDPDAAKTPRPLFTTF